MTRRTQRSTTKKNVLLLTKLLESILVQSYIKCKWSMLSIELYQLLSPEKYDINVFLFTAVLCDSFKSHVLLELSF